MRKGDLLTSIDKITIKQELEDEIWEGVSESKAPKIKKVKKMRYQFVACIVALCVPFMFSDSARAFVNNSGTEFFNYLTKSEGYNVHNIGECGLESPITMSKDGVTVTVNQCIVSDSEIFFDYSVKADNYRRKLRNLDGPESHLEVYNSKGQDITEDLFNKSVSGQYKTSEYTPGFQNVVKDDNTVEYVYIWNGKDFKYKGETLEFVIRYLEGSKQIEFPFEITIDKLYPEKNIKINKTFKDNEGNEIKITNVKSTFSKISVSGSCQIEKGMPITVVDSTGKSLNFDGFSHNTTTGDIELEMFRLGTNDTGNYKLRIYGTNGKLINEIPISFNSP